MLAAPLVIAAFALLAAVAMGTTVIVVRGVAEMRRWKHVRVTEVLLIGLLTLATTASWAGAVELARAIW